MYTMNDKGELRNIEPAYKEHWWEQERWIFTMIFAPLGVLLVVIITVVIQSVFWPEPAFTLNRSEWFCSHDHLVVAGKVIYHRCDQYNHQ